MRPSVHDVARGKWQSILPALGVPPEVLATNKPCVWCGGTDRASFTNVDGSGTYYCRQCGVHSSVDLLMHLKGWDFKAVAREVQRLADGVSTVVDKKPKPDVSKINRLLQGASPVKATDLAGRYLQARGCPLPESDVFFQPKAWGTDKGQPVCYPAMLGLIKDKDGLLSGIHKTFLEGSTKAPIDSPKQITKLSGITGGAVRLSTIVDKVGLAEGIETALSAQKLSSIPTWACLSNVFLEAVQLPDSVREVHVFADNDQAGRGSAYALCARLEKVGLTVKLHIPTLKDFNDEAVS